MKKFDIESLFEVVVDAALVKAPKPSPEVFEITLKKLSLENRQHAGSSRILSMAS
jgi:FMN phosphatase YigB (HAD superfamily)